MPTAYAKEKLGNAVHSLAVGTGTIQHRLLNAFISMSALSDRDFQGHDEALQDWQGIFRRATAIKTGSEEDGYYKTTLYAMNDDDASKLARDICALESLIDYDD